MWAEAQQGERERLWSGVEHLLGGLPPSLSARVKLLEYDLALRYAPSGEFRDIFRGADQFPLLSIGSWLIEDLALETGPDREASERHLFLAAVLSAARRHATRTILQATSFYDAEQVALVALLSERLVSEVTHLIPPGAPSWKLLESAAADGLEGMLVEQRLRPLNPIDEPEDYLTGGWFASARLLALAALTVGQRAEAAPRVSAMLQNVAEAFEITWNLRSLHDDLLAGSPSFPIAFVARAAGMSLEPWPDPTAVLGALVATNSLEPILGAAIMRVREGRRLAVELGLSTFAEYLVDVEAGFEKKRPSPSRETASAPLVAITQPTLEKAVEMAEGFLLADLSFRESWETHREGMFGASEVASRFPAGLIVEILAARGHDMSIPIEDFLAFTATNQFRYYDHPWSSIDSDTLGVYLRLTPHSSSDSTGDAARSVLACLERDVAAMGRVPVWIHDCEGSPRERPSMLDLGEGCGTVAAHLLLGLLAHDPDRHASTIQRGSLHLLGRIGEVGLGANVNYPPLFALAAFARLISKLESASQEFLDRTGTRAASKARQVLVAAFDRAIQRRVLSAQGAALLTIACLEMNSSEKRDPRWQTTILKKQRFDGSWIGEPFAAAPNRGLAVTWYSSTVLTSALCYQALTSPPDRRNPRPAG